MVNQSFLERVSCSTMATMFQAVASLFVLGTLSSVSPAGSSLPSAKLDIASVPSFSVDMQMEEVSAGGIMVMDLESGREIYGLHADERRPIGSLTKLVTYDVIRKNHTLWEIVTVPHSTLNIGGNIAGLRPGERYTIRDLLAMVLMSSANDAAHTLAVYHSGSEAAFAEEMNDRVYALGLHETQFENAIGFDAPNQYSTPRELAWLAVYVWKDPLARSFASSKLRVVRDRSGERTIVLRNTNRLLFSHPIAFSGLKTGTTLKAGQCLISVANIHNRQLVFVVLGSEDRYGDTLALFDTISQNST